MNSPLKNRIPVHMTCAVMMLFTLAIPAPQAYADWASSTQAIMGTEVHVELWHDDAQYAQRAVDAVLEEMHRIDALMSTYKPDSELSKINDEAAHSGVLVSDELFGLIKIALEVGRMTQGAFDITYASVGQFYDFRKGVTPTDEQKQVALPNVNVAHVQLDKASQSVRFSRTGVRIDLGGIAKGYAVESSVAMLKNMGIEHAIVTAGGDSRILGDHRGRPWTVGIRDPRDKNGLVVRLPLQDEAISTSGDYERFFDADGVRYHHIIEPGTGDSARSVHSVTVIGPDATMTDALSTSVFVLGKEQGLALIESLSLFEAVIIDAAGAMHFSKGLEPGS